MMWKGEGQCTKAGIGHSSDDLCELSIVLVQY
jgi:hypothetical protein